MQYASPVLLITLLASLFNITMFLGFYTRIAEVATYSESPNTDVPATHMLAPAIARRQLPLFHEKGGLVVFLHVAKTGGTTIRQEFGHLPNVNVKRVFDKQELDSRSDTIDWFLSEKNNKEVNAQEQTLLLEIHGGKGEPMTIFEIHPYIQQWRTQAKLNNKNVFTVTLLREPEPFYVSYFNFFKNPGCTRKFCDFPTMELTEENLLATAVPNHQCQYLARKVNKKQNTEVPVSREECQSVFQLMKADLDWIGSTETMQKTTLPLVSYSLAGNTAIGHNAKPRNTITVADSLSHKTLSVSAIQHLADISSYDRELYNNVASTYSLDMWENYNTITQSLLQ